MQKSEAIVNTVFDFNEKDIGISVTYKKRTVRCYIERLNYNADKYPLYKMKGGIRDYLHCVNKTHKLEWGEGSNDDATLLVFNFSATTHTGTGSALKLRMIQPYLLIQLYYSFSENTAASGQSLCIFPNSSGFCSCQRIWLKRSHNTDYNSNALLNYLRSSLCQHNKEVS